MRTNFPNAPCTFTSSELCEVENLEVPIIEDPDGEFDNFRYTIRRQYVAQSGSTFVNANDDTGMMQITVEVGWGGDSFDDNTYISTDIKTR